MKTILITGCSTGIGRALALELASRQQRVFATARRLSSIEPLRRANLTPVALDVLDEASIEAAIRTVIEEAGSIDVLVNNAGVTVSAPMVETPMHRIRSIIDTNLTAVIAMIQAVFPHMADRGGRIVNVGSVGGVLPIPYTAAYCATKAGIQMLSDVLRLELAPFGIDVITVQPAAVRTEIEDRGAEGMEAYASGASRYRPFYEGLKARVKIAKDAGISAEEYVKPLADAILAKRPPRVVRGGGNSALYQTFARFPPELRDEILLRTYALPRRR